jgi:hypothetical protein
MSLNKIAVGAAVAFISFALLSGTACQRKTEAERAAEDRIHRAMEKATGGKVGIDLRSGALTVRTPEGESVLTGGGQKWPDDLPQGVVKFESGRITGFTRADTGNAMTWTIQVMDIAENALTSYTDKLRENGWTVGVSTTMLQGGTVQATKGDLAVDVAVYGDERTAAVTYRQEKEK